MTNSKEHLEIGKLIADKTFLQEIENDKKYSLEYLDKSSVSENPHETAAIAVYKRAMIIIGSGNMQVVQGENTIDASKNLLPISSYLSHGARILIEIPKGEENNKIFNWLTSGDENINGTSSKKTQSEAISEGKYIYNRYAATHGIKIEEVTLSKESTSPDLGNSFIEVDKRDSASEMKGLLIGLIDGAYSKTAELLGLGDLYTTTNHYGIDLTLGVNIDGIDIVGNKVEGVDQDHGHLYIYYQKPTADQLGAILIGVEGSAPSSPKHSIVGASDSCTPFYGALWEDLAKKEKPETYNGCIIGNKYNGRKITLSQDTLNKIIGIKPENIDNNKLVSSVPENSTEKFLSQNTICHQDIEHSKVSDFLEILVDDTTPSDLKVSVNGLTLSGGVIDTDTVNMQPSTVEPVFSGVPTYPAVSEISSSGNIDNNKVVPSVTVHPREEFLSQNTICYQDTEHNKDSDLLAILVNNIPRDFKVGVNALALSGGVISIATVNMQQSTLVPAFNCVPAAGRAAAEIPFAAAKIPISKKSMSLALDNNIFKVTGYIMTATLVAVGVYKTIEYFFPKETQKFNNTAFWKFAEFLGVCSEQFDYLQDQIKPMMGECDMNSSNEE